MRIDRPLIIEPLNRRRHAIRAFRCGSPLLDDILQDTPRLKGCGKTYVVVSPPNVRQILACFTLLPAPQDILAHDALAVEFTAILLNILAVDQSYQKRGLGKWILAQIMRDMVRVAEQHPLDYLLIEPLDESARDYYLHLHLGFVLLADGKLVLPVETMRQALPLIEADTIAPPAS